MSTKIRPEELSDEIKSILEEASGELKIKIDSAAESVARNGADELKRTSPKYTGNRKLKYRPGAYARSWTVRRNFNGITGNSSYIILNDYHYRLTHLLEFGHVNRDGSRTRPVTHIAPVNSAVCTEFEKKVEEAVNDM